MKIIYLFLQSNPYDGMPQNMCGQCLSEVQIAFIYKKRCESSDAKLRAFFQGRLSIAEVEVEQCDNTTEFYAEEMNVEEHWFKNELSQNTTSENDIESSNFTDYAGDEMTITSSKKAVTIKNDDENLQIRIPRHLGKKLKRCPVCDKGFAKQNHLDGHMRCHSDYRKRTL